jgi:hypothetical protein
VKSTTRPALPLPVLGCLGALALGLVLVLVLLLAPGDWQAPAPAPAAPGIDLDVDIDHHHPAVRHPVAGHRARPVRTPAARKAPAAPRRSADRPAKTLTRR